MTLSVCGVVDERFLMVIFAPGGNAITCDVWFCV